MCRLSEAQSSNSHRSSAHDFGRGVVSEVGKVPILCENIGKEKVLQRPIADEDIHQTAFVTPDGSFEFFGTPFGMKNFGKTLFRGMRKLFLDMDNVDCYIDDLIIHIMDCATHLQVFDKLTKA